MEIAVWGLGKTGKAITQELELQGLPYFVVDQQSEYNEERVMREHRAMQFVLKSPGIPRNHPFLNYCLDRSIPVISELDWVCEQSKVPVIAVTGTNGKSSVCSYLHQIFAQAGVRSFLGGNIGRPYSEILRIDPVPEVAVIEVSSFQLDDSTSFSPSIRALTNVTPAHLDRYESFEHYKQSKQKIFELPGEVRFSYRPEEALVECPEVLSADLIGDHNKWNAGLAWTLACAYQAGLSSLPQWLPLKGLAHRLEVVSRSPMIINDSKATDLESLIVGLKATFSASYKTVLMGGKLTGAQDYGRIHQFLGDRKVVSFGEAAGAVASALPGTTSCSSLKEALKNIDVSEGVILCPGHSSYDEFKNFEERGQYFREATLALLNSSK